MGNIEKNLMTRKYVYAK